MRTFRRHVMPLLLCCWLLLWPGSGHTQAPSPEALAAARELVATIHLDDQYRAIVPGIVAALKPGIVQGRSEVEQQYEAIAPMLIELFDQRASDMAEAAAVIYARQFDIPDLRALTAFYRTPTGQRLLRKLPDVTRETIQAGAKFGQSLAVELRQKMVEELRKKGVRM